ncbi:chaperonin [Xenorhabdus mauleonii]|uniref:Chaperonin n=1 Tax=Xenorhabdus mauleonii TaxID=351675 RepID=A0A1I3V107_9GAMM|nr:hypothetical protein [Xenorhabdus mauleonii]PHM37584.1 chaperonin [Xenorhabdus mauleonii]SFJ88925.1 hypothetical protein SAMN05421680_1196 [Xenorhabdus mauleonii]
MKNKREMFNRIKAASNTAPLQENEKLETRSNVKAKRSKNIPIPIELDEAYKKVKANGNTTLLFTAYITEALREKLDKDGGFD